MPRKYEEYSNTDQNKLVAEFSKQNPEYWSRLQNKPEDIHRVRQILDHTEKAVDELRIEQAETRQMRVGEEAIRVFEERTEFKDFISNDVRSEVLSSSSLLEEARKRVGEQEKSEIADIHKNGETAAKFVANMQEEEKGYDMSENEQKHFKADLHKAVDTAQKARYQATKLFIQEREQLIETAKDQGSETPEKDVSIARRQTMDDVDRQEHKDIHAVFESYGWERGKRAVEFSGVDESNDPSPEKDKLVDHVKRISQENIQKAHDQSIDENDQSNNVNHGSEPEHEH